MTLEDRMNRLESQNKRLVRVLGYSAIAIIGLALIAAADLVNIVVGRVEVKNGNGETKTTLLPNGDVEVGGDITLRGKLLVANSDLISQFHKSNSTHLQKGSWQPDTIKSDEGERFKQLHTIPDRILAETRRIHRYFTSDFIDFNSSFSTPPHIILSINGIESSGDNTRFQVDFTGVTEKGFKIKIDTWGNSGINYMMINWTALEVTRNE